MFENDKDNEFFKDGESLDLGNNVDGDFADFTFLDDENIGDIFGDDKSDAPKPAQPETSTIPEAKNTENEAEEPKNEERVTEPEKAAPNEDKGTADSQSAQIPDLFETAVAKAEEKRAESTKSSLIEKLPIFSYASAKEEIADTSKTFDQLRYEKAEDFPKIPYSILSEIIAFFRSCITETSELEALAYIYTGHLLILSIMSTCRSRWFQRTA